MKGKKKVLIAEDNAELCNTLAAYFRERDEVEVLAAVYDGGGALDHLQEADVLITDLVMPNLDGFSLLERAAEMGETKPGIIVILSLIHI